jgi:hypothetical protein
LLHIAAGVSELVSIGVGFTVTVTLWLLLHPLAAMVYTYITLTGIVEVLMSVSLGLSVPEAAVLLIPATIERLQLNVAPAVALVGV